MFLHDFQPAQRYLAIRNTEEAKNMSCIVNEDGIRRRSSFLLLFSTVQHYCLYSVFNFHAEGQFVLCDKQS